MRNISKERDEKLNELEEKVEYCFNNRSLLNKAMTHSSYANQHNLPYTEHNERLEFLGDSVLGLVISEFIFKKYNNKPEGKLTRIRASMVCEASLYQKARKLGLGEYLLFGRGEEITGGKNRVSILADAYEALIAAIYIDGGLDSAKAFIKREFHEDIENVVSAKYFKDYKTSLQEYVQKEQGSVIEYELVVEDGPAHDKVFYVNVKINNQFAGRGQGRSKKEAEQQAAKAAFESLGINE